MKHSSNFSKGAVLWTSGEECEILDPMGMLDEGPESIDWELLC